MPTTASNPRNPSGANDQPARPRSAGRADGRADGGDSAVDGLGSRLRSPLARHHLALAALLLALVPVAGTGAVWSADEGALLLQATSVGSGRGWTFAHPFPAVDPDGVWFPIHLSAFAADGGYVVLGKHVAFVHLTAWLHRLGGYPAVLGLSAVSALGAASAASRMAGRIDRRAAVPALWLAGVASPLFLSAYVAWAHTLGAALVGWATVGLTTTGPRRWAMPVAPALGAAALGAACLVRTEAGLAAIALTLALGAETVSSDRGGIGRRVRIEAGIGRGIGPAVLAGLATVAGVAIDRASRVPVLGPVDPPEPGEVWGGLSGRLEAFSHTWLAPDFAARPEHLLLLGSAGMVIGAGVTARARGAAHPRVVTLLAGASLAVVVRFAISPVALIPGLVVAFPALFAGLVLLRRSDLVRTPSRTPALAVALFWGAVLATQYRHGGGGEWGGRYFAIGLPAAVAVATPPLLRAGDALGASGRRRLLGLAALVTLLPVTMGVLGLRDSRAQTAAITDRVDAALLSPGDGTDRPVVVTTMAPLGRWAWESVLRSRWLLVPAEDLADVGPRLRDLDVERFVFVSDRAGEQLADLAPWYVPIEPFDPDGGTTLDRVVIPVEAVGPRP